MLKIILITCLTYCFGLHYSQSSNQNCHSAHLQQADAQTLRNIEFQSQFTHIQEQVDYVSRTVDLKDADKYSFIIDRCKEITSGITALHRSLLRNKLLIVPQTHICPGVSTFNRTEINRYITYTEDKNKQLSLYYSTCADCSFIIPDIQKMIETTHTYFHIINQTLNRQFCANKPLLESATGVVNLNHSYYKTNLLSTKWYYGSITKSDYMILMFKRSTTYNLTNCPIATPFVRFLQQKCFACPTNSLFNLGSESCTSCTINQIFDVSSGQCEYCSGNKEIVNNSMVCRLCVLSDSQIYNSTTGKCQKCEGTRYLDEIDHLCKVISCPSNQLYFNLKTQKCESCGQFEIVDPHNATKCIKTNYVGICPPSLPFYDNTTHLCISCSNGTHYNKVSMACQANTT